MPNPVAVGAAAWSHRRSLGWLLAIAAIVPLLCFGVMFAALGGGLSSSASGAAPSDLALDTIPPRMLKLYQAAASKYGLTVGSDVAIQYGTPANRRLTLPRPRLPSATADGAATYESARSATPHKTGLWRHDDGQAAHQDTAAHA